MTKNLAAADVFLIAFLPGVCGPPLINRGIVAALSEQKPDEALAHALMFAGKAIEIPPQPGQAYKLLVETAGRAGLELPERPTNSAGFEPWNSEVRNAARRVVEASPRPALFSALEAGVAAGDLYLALHVGYTVVYLRASAPNHAILRQIAENIARSQKDAARRLAEALAAPALTPAVATLAKQLAASLAEGPDVVAAAGADSLRTYGNWQRQITNELDQLCPALSTLRDPRPPAGSDSKSNQGFDPMTTSSLSSSPTQEERALYAEILAHPAADGPRLKLAALLEQVHDPRGALIKLQLERRERQLKTRGTLGDPPKATELLRSHPEWAAEVQKLGAKKWWFLGGFIEAIELDAAAFLDNAAALYAVAPIRHVWLTQAAPRLAEILASDALSRLASLGLAHNQLDDKHAAMIAGAANLSQLSCLDLRDNGITNDGVRLLARAPNLSALKCVGLEQNPSDPLYVVEFSLQEIPIQEVLQTKFGAELSTVSWRGAFPSDFPHCLDLIARGTVPFSP